MRSALSLTLVLLAAMSGQAAGACELAGAHHPLRVLLSASQAEQGEVLELNLTSVADLRGVPALRAGRGVPTLAAACTEPPSRRYEAALIGAAPIHGP